MKRLFTSFLWVVTSALLGGCPGDPLAKLNEFKGSSGELQVIVRPVVSAYLLDSAKFKVNGTQTGLQSFLNFETPFVAWMMPEQADYVEILRCKGDVAISGRDKSLSDVEVVTMTKDAELQEFKENDYWKSSEQSGACTLIGKDFNERQQLLDMAAPSGNWRYIVRACVDQKRLADVKQAGNRNCSRQLGVSSILSYFQNKRQKIQLDALQAVMDQRAKIDTLSREIYGTTVDFNNALIECTKKEKNRQVSLTRRTAITQLVGLGISFAANIYSASSSASSSLDTYKKVWDGKGAIAGASVPIGGMLMDLTANENDFPRSCTSAEEARLKLGTLVMTFKSEHLVYATKLEESR